MATQPRALRPAEVSARPDAADEAPPYAVPAIFPQTSGTRLLSQHQDTLESGARLTRTFTREDGENFVKIEEVSLTERGARRAVLQYNPSGDLTRYEEFLDREPDGNFRRTQRFQSNNGVIETTITPGYKVTDAFVLSSGHIPPSFNLYSPYAQTRGLQLDLRS